MALVLGLISLSGPMAINMYVPAFRHIATSLRTDTATVQYSLVSFLAALAIGQNIYGPLSDRFGRKPLIYTGLIIFGAASLGASFVQSIGELIVWRFVQGLGVCAAMAIPRAVIRDLHTGAEAAQLLALMILVSSVAPLLAPLAGSGLAAILSWRAIFWFLAFAAVTGLVLVFLLLPETCPPERRVPLSPRATAASFGLLLRDREFMSLTMVTSFSLACFFAYLGGSPLIYLTLYGLEPWQYSLIYSLGAASWAGSAQFAAPLMNRMGPERLVKNSARVAATIMLVLLIGTALTVGGLWLLAIAIMVLFSAIGLMMPAVTVLALHPHGSSAGTASALMGTMGFAIGAAANGLVSALNDGTALPMVAVMTACAFAALATAWLAFVSPRPDGSHPQHGN